jgi:hypothetical protein
LTGNAPAGDTVDRGDKDFLFFFLFLTGTGKAPGDTVDIADKDKNQDQNKSAGDEEEEEEGSEPPSLPTSSQTTPKSARTFEHFEDIKHPSQAQILYIHKYLRRHKFFTYTNS